MRKKLEEMNLLDDFLFGSVVTYPEIGKNFVGTLLKIIFGKEFSNLSVYPQKIFYGSDSDLHGTRLDVYVEETESDESGEQATVYDVEPDRKDSITKVKELPYRVRFYHAKIDSRSLRTGEDYKKLKKVVIIMITPYDPFGLNRMVYTIKNRCVEEPDMKYDDGASTLFLYTGGTEGNPGNALRELMHYMENTTKQNAKNKDLQSIHRMVEIVKQDAEVSVKYMRMMEEEGVLLRRGEEKGKISLICKKIKKNKTLEEIANDLEEEVSVITPIYEAAKVFAPEYDCDLIYDWLHGISD